MSQTRTDFLKRAGLGALGVTLVPKVIRDLVPANPVPPSTKAVRNKPYPNIVYASATMYRADRLTPDWDDEE